MGTALTVVLAGRAGRLVGGQLGGSGGGRRRGWGGMGLDMAGNVPLVASWPAGVCCCLHLYHQAIEMRHRRSGSNSKKEEQEEVFSDEGEGFCDQGLILLFCPHNWNARQDVPCTGHCHLLNRAHRAAAWFGWCV